MTNRRQHARYKVALPSTFHGERVNGEGTVVDISTGGCRIRSEASVFTGDYIGITIRLSGETAVLSVELAAVRWSIGNEFGVEFIRVEAEQQKHLRAVVAQLEQVSAHRPSHNPESRDPVVVEEVRT